MSSASGGREVMTMKDSLQTAVAARHRVISEMQPEMLKADLRKPENRRFWAETGSCLDEARRVVGWSLDQLAGEVGRDARQVRRWMAGEEQTQIAAVFAVEVLRQPFVIALAKLAQCEVITEIRVRRSA